MGSFQLNGAFTNCPDPDYQSNGTPEVGRFNNGKPIRQGNEEGLLKFPPLTSGAFNELYSRYLANKDSYVAGQLPKLSGYNWRSVSAWWHEPTPTGWDGTFAHGVQMRVSKIVNN